MCEECHALPVAQGRFIRTVTSEVRAFEPTSHLGVKMNRTSKSLRLTERDIEYITWIAEQQAVRLDTLHVKMQNFYIRIF